MVQLLLQSELVTDGLFERNFMKKALVLTLALLTSLSAFADRNENRDEPVTPETQVPAQLTCEFNLIKVPIANGDDEAKTVLLFRETAMRVKTESGVNQIMISKATDDYLVYVGIYEIPYSQGIKRMTNVSIQDYKTGIVEGMGINGIQPSFEKTLYSSKKLSIFNDPTNWQVTLSCN